MGRVTYEEMAATWPTSTSEYARPMNEIPKVVFSKTLQQADWPESKSPAATSPKRSTASSANRGTT
jgi:dihydrofolate reductase